MVNQMILDWSMPLALAKAGNICRPPSKLGAPSFLPSRSLGLVMPLDLSDTATSGKPSSAM